MAADPSAPEPPEAAAWSSEGWSGSQLALSRPKARKRRTFASPDACQVAGCTSKLQEAYHRVRRRGRQAGGAPAAAAARLAQTPGPRAS